MKPVIHPHDLSLDHWTQGELYESRDQSFGKMLGLEKLGISYCQVPPGKSGCPFHNHHHVDEAFVILSGIGRYRFGSEHYDVGPGNVLGAPAGGPDTAHQLINTGQTPLIYFAISANAAADLVEYPDSGKFQAISKRSDGERFRFVGRSDSARDYWEDEPGA
ncbi:cupin domain-containing protein [Oryzifoliimicrobium ureilyticus]|uniref:cupin domain-containing protein n=1 Tax=Oryzifoliimicrobium ureilyticus TaxID=3113724 RepID=UPI0030763319